MEDLKAAIVEQQKRQEEEEQKESGKPEHHSVHQSRTGVLETGEDGNSHILPGVAITTLWDSHSSDGESSVDPVVVEDLNRQIGELTDQLHEAFDKYTEVTEKNQELSDELEKVRASQIEHAEYKTLSESLMNSMRSDLQKELTARENLGSRLLEGQSQIEELKAELKRTKKEHIQYQYREDDDVSKLQQSMDTLMDEKKLMEEQLEDLQKVRTALRTEQDKHTNVSRQYTALKAALAEETTRSSELSRTIEEMNASRVQSDATLGDQSMALDRSRSEIDHLKAQQNIQRKRFTETDEQLQQTRTKLSQAQGKIAELQSEVASRAGLAAVSDKQMLALQQKCSELTDMVNQAKVANEAAGSEKSELTAKVDALTIEKRHAEEELTAMKLDVDRKIRLAVQSKVSAEKMRAQLKEAMKESKIKDLKQELENLTQKSSQELEELRNKSKLEIMDLHTSLAPRSELDDATGQMIAAQEKAQDLELRKEELEQQNKALETEAQALRSGGTLTQEVNNACRHFERSGNDKLTSANCVLRINSGSKQSSYRCKKLWRSSPQQRRRLKTYIHA